MAEVIWSPAAIDDMDSIAAYIARDSEYSAALFVGRVTDAVEQLAEFPISGRIIPEIGNELSREIFYRHYRIMYLIEGDEVWITGVVHGARNWSPD